ncbi:MAG: hypothetical protein R3185_00910 [Candidatus Thermoplasmatota archaeon]|nr:hypothetical protein [Candidatus Thermoplasmatota archaeon]
MVERSPARLSVLLLALGLLVAPVALAETGTDEEAHDGACKPHPDDPGVAVCHPPEACRGQLYETPECTPPDACTQVDDWTFHCEEPHADGDRYEDDRYEDHDRYADDDRYHEEDRYHDDDRYEDHDGPPEHHDEPPCEPTDDPYVMVCKAPEHCEDRMHETPECTPPDFCQANGDGTFTCEIPEEHRHDEDRPAEDGPRYEGDRYEDAPHHEEPYRDHEGDHEPDCEPVEGEHAMLCKPPAACEGQLYQTPECTPPPECEEVEDGLFLCKPPEDHRPRSGEGDHRPPPPGAAPCPDGGCSLADQLFGDEELFEDEGPDWEAVRMEAHGIIREAMQGFREDLGDLRHEYKASLGDLREAYHEGKEELRTEYEACMDDARETMDRDAAWACRDAATQGLEDLRDGIREEHEQVKADLLDQAQATRDAACEDLEAELRALLDRHGVLDAGVEDLIPPEALALCHGGAA